MLSPILAVFIKSQLKLGLFAFSWSHVTSRSLFICYSQDAAAKNQTNHLSKPTWQLGTYLIYAASAFPPALDKPKPRRTGYRTCQFLTFAVANLVSLSDLGFLCRCSISLSESNSPLHTNPINVTTQNLMWEGKQDSLFTLCLSPILGHCLTMNLDTNSSCSLQAVPHMWDIYYRNHLPIFLVQLFHQV